MPSINRPPKGQNPHGGRREGAGRPPGPNGRGAAFKHIRELARSHSPEALETIVNIMNTSDDDRLCFDCAIAIIERGYGKPRQAEVVEQQDNLTGGYKTFEELRAAVIASGVPLDRLNEPRLIKHDNET